MPTHQDNSLQDDLPRLLFLVGEAYIRSGASSASATQALLAICSAAGHTDATVSITLGQITLSGVPGRGDPHRTLVRDIPMGSLDIWRRSRAEEAVSAFLLGELSVQEASERLALQSHRPHASARWWGIAGAGVIGFGFSLLLGGRGLVPLAAAVSAVLVALVFQRIDRTQTPAIFNYAACGLVAVLASVLFSQVIGLAETTTCIVASLAARLAGVTSYGAVQDAITGWYLTAMGRILDAIACTAGLVAGVSAGIGIATALLGPQVRLIETVETSAATSGLSAWALPLLGAALVSAGYAFSSGGSLVKTLSLTALGGAGYLGSLLLSQTWLTDYTAITLAALGVGSLSVLLSPPLKISSNAVMTVGLLPLFPGMLVYQGLLGTLYSLEDADTTLVAAIITTFCLSMGGTLGQYLTSESLWALRHLQFHRRYPDQHYDSSPLTERRGRDVMLPNFRRPFSRAE